MGQLLSRLSSPPPPPPPELLMDDFHNADEFDIPEGGQAEGGAAGGQPLLVGQVNNGFDFGDEPEDIIVHAGVERSSPEPLRSRSCSVSSQEVENESSDDDDEEDEGVSTTHHMAGSESDEEILFTRHRRRRGIDDENGEQGGGLSTTTKVCIVLGVAGLLLTGVGVGVLALRGNSNRNNSSLVTPLPTFSPSPLPTLGPCDPGPFDERHLNHTHVPGNLTDPCVRPQSNNTETSAYTHGPVIIETGDTGDTGDTGACNGRPTPPSAVSSQCETEAMRLWENATQAAMFIANYNMTAVMQGNTDNSMPMVSIIMALWRLVDLTEDCEQVAIFVFQLACAWGAGGGNGGEWLDPNPRAAFHWLCNTLASLGVTGNEDGDYIDRFRQIFLGQE